MCNHSGDQKDTRDNTAPNDSKKAPSNGATRALHPPFANIPKTVLINPA